MTDTSIFDELLTDTVSCVRIASPETIRSWSKGEVKNPEALNYRTFKPERGGLFCERIFGPVNNFECSCGKYKRIKHKGVICDRCGVEVALARVRRERMGHIELAAPVTHIWFFKGIPSRIGLLLGMSKRTLERIIYFEDYVIIEPRHTGMVKGQILSETEFRHAVDSFGDNSFEAGMGAEAIRKLLSDVDLAARAVKLKEQIHGTRAKQTRKKLAKRLKLVQGLYASKTRPEWMVLEVLPVIPPDLRPLDLLLGVGVFRMDRAPEKNQRLDAGRESSSKECGSQPECSANWSHDDPAGG
jgi:DNA-directed RNA polymerase subunit beta'